MRQEPDDNKHHFFKNGAGFTLVEMVVVIAVIAIIGTMSVGFIRSSVASYISTEGNLELADRTDIALRRIARDVRNSLPNSMRVSVSGSNSYLEFIPIQGAGRYRSGASSGDPLDFTAADTSFDVLGPSVNVSSGNKLVIYNLGIDVSDVYIGNNTAVISTVGNGIQNIGFASKQFALSSPNNRFFIVGGASSYVCDMSTGQLLQYAGYSFSSSQPSSLASLDSLTTKHVVLDGLTGCSIAYSPGVLQRTGVVTITLQVASNGAVVRLVHLVNVVNSP